MNVSMEIQAPLGISAALPAEPHPFGELARGAGPEERILHATMNLIERRGIERLTTRAIAAEAEVNLALVNYYFRSKSELLRAALAKGLGNMLADAAAYLAQPWPSKRECLASILEYLVGGSMRFPRLTSAILHCPADYLSVGPSPAEKLGSIILEATRDLAYELGLRDEGAIATRAALVVAAALFPVVEPQLFGAGTGAPVDAEALASSEARRAFASLLAADAAAALEREAMAGFGAPAP